jgi:hypothetical protein
MASAIDTEKWETGIDATDTDIKEVKAFVDWRLSIYKEEKATSEPDPPCNQQNQLLTI